MSTNQYIGARYVPVFADPVEWSDTRAYEHLMMVQHNGETYISKQAVPIGIQLPDDQHGEESNEFWVHMSNWNAQVESYRQEVLQYNGRISTLEDDLPIADFDSVNTVKKAISDTADLLPAASFDSVNTVKKAIDDANNDIIAIQGDITTITSDNWVTPARIANNTYQICANVYGEYDLDSSFDIDFGSELLQGCCSDANYYYLFTYDNTDPTVQYIYKVDKSDTSVYTKTQYATLGHGNSMESYGNYLFVTTSSNSGVIKIEKSTMAIVNTYAYNYYAICNYDNKWYGYDVDIPLQRVRLLELDDNFEVTKTTYTNLDPHDLSMQGMTYDGEYFYIVSAYPHYIWVLNENGACCGAEQLLVYQSDNDGIAAFEVQDIERTGDGNFRVFANYFFTNHNQVISVKTNPIYYKSQSYIGKNRITADIGGKGAGAVIAWYSASKSTFSDLIRVKMTGNHNLYINCESLSNLIISFGGGTTTTFNINAGTVYNTTFNLDGTVEFNHPTDAIMNNCKFLCSSSNVTMNISAILYMQNCQFMVRGSGFKLGYCTGWYQQSTILWYNSNATFAADNVSSWDIIAMRGNGNRFSFAANKASAGASGVFASQTGWANLFLFYDQVSVTP